MSELLSAMATQPDTPPAPVDKRPPNPATTSEPQTLQHIAEDQHNASPGATKGSSPTSVFVNSEPIREDQVRNAVTFLSHPRIKGTPVIQRRSFLERKGLTKEEIDEAFRRVPDPPPTVSTSQPDAANQNGQMMSSPNVQPQMATQMMQPIPTVSVDGTSRVRSLYQFHWSHALLAVGFLASSGVGMALFFKKSVIPRLKSWIRQVMMEEDGSVEKNHLKPSLAEEVAAAKAAASAAADVARASQEMVISKQEEKRYFEELSHLLNTQIKEMKTMSNAIQKLEVSGQGEFYAGIKSKNNQGRVSDAGGSTIMPTVQRGERPSNGWQINYLPPNPNQPVAGPQVARGSKPWEVPYRSNGVLQSQGKGNGSSPGFYSNQSNGDSSLPWWQKRNVRITEIKSEEIPKASASTTVSAERPPQRAWVPPQPPPVAMPEAAEAIRQPKRPLPQKEVLADDKQLAHSSEVTEEMETVTKLSEPASELEANSGDSGVGTSDVQT